VRLEQRGLPGVDALLGDREERADVAVQLVLRAVIGVENWMIPSLPASAKPFRAALIVSDDVQLMAG
jgi:hypothetical protein